MLPPQPEEESKTNNENIEYAPITSSMNMLLQPIQENLEDHRPSFTTITTLPKFHTRKSVRYSAKQRFKVSKKRRKKRKRKDDDIELEEENDADDDDNDDYDMWRRPPIVDAQANNDGRQLILTEYDGLHENIDHFLDLMLEAETECDKLAQLMCNKKLSTKDIQRNPDKYELSDILRLDDPNDDGGLNPDDYDIDMREMEHLFHKFNNDALHSFMSSYFDEKLPFEPRQPFPMGLIETDITKERRFKTEKNADYMNQHRRKNKQRLREKHRKKKERARKKRRKDKKMRMKLAKKKLNALQERLSKQLAPDTMDILFNPQIIDPNKSEEKEEIDLDGDIKDEEVTEDVRTDDEALGAVQNEEAKDRIKKLRLDRVKSRRKARMDSDRHSQAIQSPMIQHLLEINGNDEQPQFDDEEQLKKGIHDVFDEQQLSMSAPPAMSKDYDGTVKRYQRPIKMDHVEKVYKYVLFKAARAYYKMQYVDNMHITECVEKEMEKNKRAYDQIKYQIETQNENKMDICTNVKIRIGDNEEDVNEIKCDIDMLWYINMKKKRDTDVLVQKHYVLKQSAMLQLLSMGVELDDIDPDPELKEDEVSFSEMKQAFMDGVDGLQINAEDKLINHDEDDDNVRMSAIVYDSDDDIANDQRWIKRGKWIQKALTDFCENEVKTNTYNAKPWKKLHSKYVDEFVRKFCGHYPFESRPVVWKRIWHQDCNEKSEFWPDEWMDLFNAGKLNINELNSALELDDSCLRSVKCMNQMTGELFKSKQLKHGKLFSENDEMRAFYDRVLNNIPSLPKNLEDVSLPKVIWKLNQSELSKYGTYLLANWKQPSNGKVTTNTHNEKFPLAQFQQDIEQRRWHGSMKWYIYRLRYWEASDIMDFLDESEGKEGVEWFGSNDYDSDKFVLLEDRICIQNDHCYGSPSLFVWSHDFCNETGKSAPIKIRNYGVSADIASTDSIIQSEKSIFNLSAPIVPTGKMPVDGPLRSGTKVAIGAQDPLELDDVNGIIAMDAYIPPIFNLSVYDDIDTLCYNWNRVNHDDIADRASSKRMSFTNKNSAFDSLICDENNILKSWDESGKWIDYNNYPVFDGDHHSHPSVLSNAFFFHNFLCRTFHYGAKNIAKINYPRNWRQSVFNDDDAWTLSFGFTHPRPIAPEKYAVLFYKKDCIEVRITSDTEKVDDDSACKTTDLTPQHVEEANREQFEVISSAQKYRWTEERLEIMLNIDCDGKQKAVPLFSELIRIQFDHLDCFHEINKDFAHAKSANKKFIFAENNFNSHVVIVSKSSGGRIKCYLDARLVCNKDIADLIAPKMANCKNAKSTLLRNDDEDEEHDKNHFLVAHKPGNKEGRVHGLFHGYLYGISLHAADLQAFELNTLYRQLCVHRDLHVVSTWFRNKNELSNSIYKQFL